jgi:cell division protein FtsL
MSAREFSWATVCALITVTILALGILLVRVNNERVDQAYGLKKLKSRIDQAQDLRSKLEVERNNLMSHHRLGRMAEQYGLKPAEPGQVRVLGSDREKAGKP